MTKKDTGSVMILDDFENKSSLNYWKGTITLSSEFPSHGRKCCKLVPSKNLPLWIETINIVSDWSPFQYLKFDIYNPSEQLYYGTIQIFDKAGNDEDAEFRGQSYNGEKLFLNTGWNHFEFLIHNAMTEEGDRHLAIESIRKLRFAFGITDTSLYIDNIRLVKGTEGVLTKSKINPADCIILIDNRDVYPSLAGPVEKIKVGRDIITLRENAENAIRQLKNEVRLAEMQGFQTFYQKIPLITADIGIGIRSKLVWFQNDNEERKILNYVISSCKKASEEISSMLASKKNSGLKQEPENEVSSASFFVPPYPPLNELRQSDGFYRDKSGRPQIVFSMLQINEGPLLEYFAPFDHRIESYTVGGGSRYNIENSPVYAAFHSFPGTKRVGWDGWCGHLIKDRWAMGGKKEDVVICLESPEIRKAILEYIKVHSEEWKSNPHLLYNIMAYELQYICFCRKSQQMFREWLVKKYNSIGKLNNTWNTSYSSFSDIYAPETRNARPVDNVNRAAWYDWADFNTRRFTDYLKWVKDEMRKYEDKIPICAGGTSSMLSSSNSVTGIDEEMIINEVDDVILNESGSSVIFSDLLLSLSSKKKIMVDPEMGGSVHNLLLQFLHGKSDISKWWWGAYPSTEYMHMNQTSLPHSKEISLSDIDEVLKLSLDIRRLGAEIAEFTKGDPEIAILYSKTSILQVPPLLVQAGTTPYIDELYSVWEGSRFLGCRVGFISEKQILDKKLNKFKLLIIPAVKYIVPEVVTEIKEYLAKGGTVVMIPESFNFDQYAKECNKINEFGIKIINVTFPEVVGEEERTQNYDQSFSQKLIYGNVKRKILTDKVDIFEFSVSPPDMISEGLVQTIDPGNNTVIGRFEDGHPAIVHVKSGKGSLYYLAAPLKTQSYHQLLSPIVKKLGIKRPVIAVDNKDDLITGVEVRGVENKSEYLVYVSNLTPDTMEFDLKARSEIKFVTDLRTTRIIEGNHIKTLPFGETIYKIEKKDN